MPPKKKPRNYVNNKALYEHLKVYHAEYHKAKAQGLPLPKIPNYVGECILLIAQRLATKRSWNGYSYIDEMISDGIENVCLGRHTKILTMEHGPIEIEKILHQTVTIKAADGKWRPANVKSYGKQKLYEYGFCSKGKEEKNIQQKVLATKNHRWFIKGRLNNKKCIDWKEEVINDLKVGDYLANAPVLEKMNKTAILHGIIFGDGTGHKKLVSKDISLVTPQGNDYAFIRICKKGIDGEEMINAFIEAGYEPKYPPHAKGDPIFYIGKFPFVKEVPFTNDPSYIAGFIHGWWLADGSKTRDTLSSLEITTTDTIAVEWLRNYSAYAGYHFVGYRKIDYSKSSYGYDEKKSKSLYVIHLQKSENYFPRVRYVKEHGEDEVFCLEEPVTNGFVLANGLLTGNCMYIHNFDPNRFNMPFAYISKIMRWAFIRRINFEKKQQYLMIRNSRDHLLLDQLNPNMIMGVVELYDNLQDFMLEYEEKNNIEPYKKKDRKRVACKEISEFWA